PADEEAGIADGRGRRRCLAECHRLWPELSREPAHGCGGRIERLIPGNLFPARVAISLRAAAAQGPHQSARTVDKCRRGTPLGADGGARGMGRVRAKPREAPVFYGRDSAAARDAEAAVTLNLVAISNIGRHAPPPLPIETGGVRAPSILCP